MPDMSEMNGGDFKETLEDKLAETLNERGNRYGDFREIASISEQIQTLVFASDSLKKPELRLNRAQRECVRQLSTKLARIACGDAQYPDNWHDIRGYGQLGEKHCK